MKTVKEPVKQEMKLSEAFVMWKHKAKSGLDYFKGYDLNKIKLVGFFNSNKKNPKEPDVRIYTVDAEGKQDKEVASLWEYVSKNGNRYLNGKTDEKENLVAFYSKDEDDKKPYIRAYFKED